MEVVAILNEKGGVGKTTLTANLGYLLAAEFQRSTLLVDLDQQANLSSLFHPDPGAEPSMSSVFRTRGFTIDRCLSEAHVNGAPVPGLSIAHANIGLSQAIRDIPVRTNREKLLSKALSVVIHDYVLIDCPPSADDAVLNAIYAADLVLVPVEMGGFASNAIQDVLDLIADVKGYESPGTMLAQERVRFVRNKLDKRVPALNAKVNEQLTPIESYLTQTTCRVASSISHAVMAGNPLAVQSPDSPLLDDYRQLIKEVLL